MRHLLMLLLILPSVMGGTPCPPRRDIHPCICLNYPIGKKKVETTLICQNLQSVDSIKAIEPALMEMEVDKFLLYDSFWTHDGRRLLAQNMPANGFSGYRIKEIQILDSKLDSFACPLEMNCRTSYLNRYSSINTTILNKDACNVAFTTLVSCPSHIEYFEFREGSFPDDAIKPDFFPETMSKLKVLILKSNKISRIERRTFSSIKFPVLHALDLAYNSLRDVKGIFNSPMKLRHLDLSYNPIRSIGDLTNLPHLQSLKLKDCNIVYLLENDWQNIPSGLRHIDFSGNKLECNCGFKFINSTFHLNTDLIGTCVKPKALENMKLRRASRLLNERCDENNNIRASKIKKAKQS